MLRRVKKVRRKMKKSLLKSKHQRCLQRLVRLKQPNLILKNLRLKKKRWVIKRRRRPMSKGRETKMERVCLKMPLRTSRQLYSCLRTSFRVL
jgi:hypothetical protein